MATPCVGYAKTYGDDVLPSAVPVVVGTIFRITTKLRELSTPPGGSGTAGATARFLWCDTVTVPHQLWVYVIGTNQYDMPIGETNPPPVGTIPAGGVAAYAPYVDWQPQSAVFSPRTQLSGYLVCLVVMPANPSHSQPAFDPGTTVSLSQTYDGSYVVH